ncbi:hypothetical protein PLICBS_000245 [Purpureocillium lilacinum]|uniref:uncharacterized protein n=1 Tax=Purpureocillium lilacinum TaxID=33203 RepID=UPI00208CE818|nr:hypothetical protein PLICBS_000245 [Purpureocillium lilacinum]
MDVSTRNGAVAATAVFTALQVAATGLCVYLKSSRAAGYLRFYAVIPFGIYGGFSIQMSFKKRYGPDGATSRIGPVWVSQGIHGLVGIFLIPWAFIGFYVVRRLRRWVVYKSAWDWDERMQWSANFYLALLDACYAACIITAIVLGSRFTPWNYSRCDEYRVYDSWPIERDGGNDDCRQMLTSQIVAVLVLLVLCAQFTLIIPVASLPSTLRAPLFYFYRFLRLRRPAAAHHHPPPSHAWQHDAVSEKAPLLLPERPSLETAFRHDAIAASLARYMHFDDVANVSRTSKAMSRAVFAPSVANAADDDDSCRRGRDAAAVARLDMLCEATCSDSGGGSLKSECWACAKVICEGCHSQRTHLTEPRTTAHLTKCHALCTRCYIRRPGARPAPFLGSWNPDDLAAQHGIACKRLILKAKTPLVGPVFVS